MHRLIVVSATAIVTVTALLIPTGAGAGGGGCGPQGGHTDGRGYKGVTVPIEECSFTPTVLYVDPGDVVTWVNRDEGPHMVTGAGLMWGDGDLLKKDAMVTHAFKSEGIYPYFCDLHPRMVGAVVVGDPAVAKRAAAPTKVDIERIFDSPEEPRVAAVAESVPASATAGDEGLTWLKVLALVILSGIVGWAAGAFVRSRRSKLEEDSV